MQQLQSLLVNDFVGRTRSWAGFCSGCSAPKDYKAFENRVHRNWTYYRSNYLVIGAVLALFAGWRAATALYTIALLCAYALARKRDPIRCSSRRLTPYEILAALAVAALLTLFVLGAFLAASAVVLAVVLVVLVHGAVRSERSGPRGASDGGGSGKKEYDDEGFFVRSFADGVKALLGFGKPRIAQSKQGLGGVAYGHGAGRSGAARSDDEGGGGGSSSNGDDIEGRAPLSDSGARSGAGPAFYPAGGAMTHAPLHSGSAMQPMQPPSYGYGDAMPSAYDATAIAQDAPGYAAAGGAALGGLSRRGGYAAPAAPVAAAPLPRPPHVRSD